MQTTETVYKNRSNPNRVAFFEDNAAMNFAAVTRIVCKLYTNDGDLASTVDSADSPVLLVTGTDISASPNTNNVIVFTLNALILSGMHYAEVIVYDPTHPDGQAIAHHESPDDLLAFNFVDA